MQSRKSRKGVKTTQVLVDLGDGCKIERDANCFILRRGSVNLFYTSLESIFRALRQGAIGKKRTICKLDEWIAALEEANQEMERIISEFSKAQRLRDAE